MPNYDSNGDLNVSVLVAMWSTLTMGRKPVMKVMTHERSLGLTVDDNILVHM